MIKGFIQVNDYSHGSVTLALSTILEVQRVYGESYPAAIKVTSHTDDPWLRVIESYEKMLNMMAEAS